MEKHWQGLFLWHPPDAELRLQPAGSSDRAGSTGWGRGPLPATACPGAAGEGDIWQRFPSPVRLPPWLRRGEDLQTRGRLWSFWPAFGASEDAGAGARCEEGPDSSCLQGLLGGIAPAPGGVCITASACPVPLLVTVLGSGRSGTQRWREGERRGSSLPFHRRKTCCLF